MPDPSPPRLYVAGDLSLDVLVRPRAPLVPGDDTPARVALAGGGQGANVAAWARWARPDVDVHLITQAGDDAVSRLLLRALRRHGVVVHAAVAGRGTRVVSLVEGERRSLLADVGDGAWAPLPVDPERGPAVLYVSGYVLVRRGSAPWLRGALAWARRTGARLAVTPSARSVLWRDGLGGERWRRLASGAHILLANADEAAALTGEAMARRAAQGLAAARQIALVTQGRRGAWLAQAGLPARHVAAAARARVVDPTGAGDAVAGAFLAALAAGAQPYAAASEAMAAGSAAVGRSGAWP